MRIVRLWVVFLALTATALASNGTYPKYASVDVKNAIDKGDAALASGDRQLALALYKGSLYTEPVRLALAADTVENPEQIRAVKSALATWNRELDGDLPVALVEKEGDADVLIKFVDAIPERGEDALGLIQLEKRFRWSKSSHSYSCKGTISVVRTSMGSRLNTDETTDVVMHEIGHLLGLGDVDDTRLVMGPLERGKPLARPSAAEVQDVKSLRKSLRQRISSAESRP